MKQKHFEAFHPRCPVCLGRQIEAPLTIGRVMLEEQNDVLEGILLCPERMCQREFPIIDGIPIVVADIRNYLASHLPAITARSDLSPTLESLIGDACGPGADYDVRRQHLSSYCWDHYADLDVEEPPGMVQPGAVVDAVQDALDAAQPSDSGCILDVGCSVGRSSFELASRTRALVLGVDLNFSMLRFASQVLRRQRVCYPRRRVGVVYDRREFDVELDRQAAVDFWACDAMTLPFADATCDFSLALNILDCMPSPRDLFLSLARILKPTGTAVLSSPYDWSSSATPIENWLGGHSQRSTGRGGSEYVVQQTLAEAGPTGVGLRLVKEGEAPPWHVRLHDRGTMTYRNHRLVLARS